MIIDKDIISSNLKETVFDISLTSPNIYIQGLYNKYSRFISQTPWELNGEKVFDTSVEEIIKSKFCELYQTE